MQVGREVVEFDEEGGEDAAEAGGDGDEPDGGVADGGREDLSRVDVDDAEAGRDAQLAEEGLPAHKGLDR